MPRPGPRPYECVRRAWHSDRHQPMRGSLIQEIFRVVNGIHNPATKKNKEWQEKLPVVVLKAEEIMYSKANSEAEYMDVKTLYDRANDAIDTIIRREEGGETGDLLQPCIEAALILGCTATRASRSQRNSNPRCYLRPRTQEPSSLRPRVPESVPQGGGPSHLQLLPSGNPTSSPQFMPYNSNIPRSMTVDSTQLGLESCSPATVENTPAICQEVPLSSEILPQFVGNQNFLISTNPSMNLGRVYPLYYGTYYQSTRPQFGFQAPQSSHSNAAVLDTPHVQSTKEPRVKDFLQNIFSSDKPVNASNRITQADSRNTSENPPGIDCDLSLRLGILSAPCATAGTSLPPAVEEVRSSSSEEGSKSGDRPPQIDKEFCFFPQKNADDPSESCSRKRSSEGEGMNLESSSRKRKEPVRSSAEDVHFHQQPKFSPDLFSGRMKKPDT
ncbi:hypothetical protein BVC80_9067g71 [Macleaya cordata]|uniref:Coactivator CBP n=1 Tax=Macleaya cordata TaxID=56857 RepID=A0A200PNV9_MACCD|nr:hypothetical protein BVC80_9067g71 [Macleaya cordata]